MPSVLRRGTSLPLRVRLGLALWLAEPKLSFAERRLVEVGGVEPPSGKALAERLRAYAAFDPGSGMPTAGLIRFPAPDCTCLGAQVSGPQTRPAEVMPHKA